MDPRRHSPAAERNKEPILKCLSDMLGARGSMLEIASGSGQHVVHLARAMPKWTFLPTDMDADALRSIEALRGDSGLPNISPAIHLDISTSGWSQPLEEQVFDAMLCINMVHIAPWEATVRWLAECTKVLSPGGVLVLYGPYKRNGRPTSPGNRNFDSMLRQQAAHMGLRDLEKIEKLAAEQGFRRFEPIDMPANNLLLRFELPPEPR
ncbi:MAG: DUF938 domain-containing protein [Myxococcota bacterium]